MDVTFKVLRFILDLHCAAIHDLFAPFGRTKIDTRLDDIRKAHERAFEQDPVRRECKGLQGLLDREKARR